jgi:hypothetical protein
VCRQAGRQSNKLAMLGLVTRKSLGVLHLQTLPATKGLDAVDVRWQGSLLVVAGRAEGHARLMH